MLAFGVALLTIPTCAFLYLLRQHVKDSRKIGPDVRAACRMLADGEVPPLTLEDPAVRHNWGVYYAGCTRRERDATAAEIALYRESRAIGMAKRISEARMDLLDGGEE